MTLARRVVREKRSLVVPLGVALVVNVGIYGLAVYPLSQRVARADRRAQAAASALGDAQRGHAAAQALVTGKTRADRELEQFYRQALPGDWAAARRVTYLHLVQLAQQANLKPTRSGAEPLLDKETGLAKMRMTMILAGSYRDIRRFIHDLETSPEFVVIEDVVLAQTQAGETAPLVLTLDVATYYWTGGRSD